MTRRIIVPEKRVLGVAGRRGSGKDYLADYLIKTYGAAKHVFSTPMRECLTILGVPITTKNLQDFSTITRETFGQDTYSKVLNARAINDPNPLVIVAGIRRPPDVISLRDIPGFKLIGIDAPIETRYQRVKNRGEKAEEKDLPWEEFLKIENAEAESQIPACLAVADFMIDNGGTLDQLHARIDEILVALGFKPREYTGYVGYRD